MAMNNRLMRPVTAADVSASVTYHAEALAWKTAAEANGGTVSTPTLAAVSTFCTAIDAAGIRDRFIRLSILCGGNLSAALVPLYRGASPTGTQYGNAADSNIGPFVSADYSETSGLNGNGSTKALDPGIDLPTCYSFGMEYDNAHAMVYRQDALGENEGGTVLGGYVDGDFVGFVFRHDNNATEFFSGDYQGDYVVAGTSATNPGMYLSQIGSGPDGVMLRNNSSIKTGQTLPFATSFDAIAANVLVFGDDDGFGNIASPIAARLSAYSFGKAFTSSGQRTAFYDAMVALQTALGRI